MIIAIIASAVTLGTVGLFVLRYSHNNYAGSPHCQNSMYSHGATYVIASIYAIVGAGITAAILGFIQ